MKKQTSKNAGFSIIELVIIVVLIGLLVGLLVPALNPIFSTAAQKCAYQTEALVAKSKIYAMGRSEDVYVMLYKNDKDEIWCDQLEGSEIVSSELVGSSRVAVQITPPGEATYTLTEAEPLYISFKRATGALRVFGKTTAEPAGGYVSGDIAVINSVAGGKLYEISIIATTGRHEVTRP